jgi:serine protease Do
MGAAVEALCQDLPVSSQSPLLIGAKVALVLIAGGAAVYWLRPAPVPRKPRPAAFTITTGPASDTPPVTTLPVTAAPSAAPAPETPSDAPVPSAAERVAAAMARSKQAEADAWAARAGVLPQPSAMPLEDIVARAMPGVVMVQSDKMRGSGFFVRPDLVVTNAHVTAGAFAVTLTTQAGIKMPGRVTQMSTEYDIALIQVAASGPADPSLRLGGSASLRLGQGIVALGWAQSPSQNPLTRGVITGLRLLGERQMVQTDATPNPGDSGGPLIDRNGDVVGITTLRFDNGSGGLAIPIDDVKPFIARTSVVR